MGCNFSVDRKDNEFKDNSLVLIYTETIKQQIKENKILLYTLSDSEISKKAKMLLRKQPLEFEYFDIDKLKDKKTVLIALGNITNEKKEPFVFIKGKYQGGLQELEELILDGELDA